MKFLSITALTLFNMLFRSFAFMQLWNWFMLPVFAVSMPYIPAIGITFLISLLLAPVGLQLATICEKMANSKEDKITLRIATFIVPFIFLFLGYILTFFL